MTEFSDFVRDIGDNFVTLQRYWLLIDYMKKAVLTKLTMEQYRELECRRIQFGFKSMYEFLEGIVGMALTQFQRMDLKRKEQDMTIHDEVDEMFRELEERTYVTYGNKPKRDVPTPQARAERAEAGI